MLIPYQRPLNTIVCKGCCYFCLDSSLANSAWRHVYLFRAPAAQGLSRDSPTRSRLPPRLPSYGSHTGSTASPRLARLWGQRSTSRKSPGPGAACSDGSGEAGEETRAAPALCTVPLPSPACLTASASTHGAPHPDGASRGAGNAHASHGRCSVSGGGGRTPPPSGAGECGADIEGPDDTCSTLGRHTVLPVCHMSVCM